jgi:hypothetical protein
MSAVKNQKGEAVQNKTGRSWSNWFSILDAAGARKMNYKEIVAILLSQHRLRRWWAQKITILYELERGLRKKHQTQTGYQIIVSRNLPFQVNKLFKMWRERRERRKWLIADALTISTVTTNKMLRGSWENGKTRVEVSFHPKGPKRCQVVVRHTKLGGSSEASRLKEYWSKALDSLKESVGN